MTRVRCTVDSCEFWGTEQRCTADEIWVKNDITGDPGAFTDHFINASREEFGDDLSASVTGKKRVDLQQSKSAHTSPQTCCDTMRPKKG